MARIAREDVEIMVHATAPSRGLDDSRYRKIAQAYLDFEPRLRQNLEKTERESQASYSPEPETIVESIPISANEAASIDGRYMDSPHLSFDSVLDNRGYTSLGGTVTLHDGDREISERFISSSHSVSDTQPDQSQRETSSSSPTKGLEHFLRSRVKSSNKIHCKDSAPTHEGSAQIIQSSPPERTVAGPRAREIKQSIPAPQIEQNDLQLQEAPTPPHGANTAPSPWSLLLEIRPSPPATGNESLIPDMLLTTYLRDLGERMPCPYKPTEQKRELRPLERGYWLIDCGTWNEELRYLCWETLGRLVGGDHVGWGVWCVRTSRYESIRVYCWGITVPHIYLTLYVASERKIKGTSPCWIGGNGEVIVRMP